MARAVSFGENLLFQCASFGFYPWICRCFFFWFLFLFFESILGRDGVAEMGICMCEHLWLVTLLTYVIEKTSRMSLRSIELIAIYCLEDLF